MRVRGIHVLGLTVALGVGLASAVVLARPKRNAGCPASAPESGARCARKNAVCSYRCEGEGHRDLSCDCGKDEKGIWHWQCSSAAILPWPRMLTIPRAYESFADHGVAQTPRRAETCGEKCREPSRGRTERGEGEKGRSESRDGRETRCSV